MKIKELRLRAGLTQVQLAEEIHVTQSAIVAWESGKKYPSSQRLPALAKALAVEIQELFTADETA